MSLALIARMDADETAAWLAALAQALPGEQITVWNPADGAAACRTAEIALVANPPRGVLAQLPRLRFIQSLWAGVDGLLADPELPADLPLARMVDAAMSRAMAETALWTALAVQRGFFRYAVQQRAALWRPLATRCSDELAVGVLGLGEMGGTTAQCLAQQGFRVRGWSRIAKSIPHIDTVHGAAGLDALLGDCELVINLLPLTPDTRGLFDAARLARLRPGATFANFARGAQLVEADLLSALAQGRPAHAVLDVFANEPLPAEHPFWAHPQVTVLPHVAAPTDPRSAVALVARNLAAWRAGRPIAHLVDRARGY